MSKIFDLVKKMYKTRDGSPFELPKGECEIFETIFKKTFPRLHLMTYTQYGKSDTSALAVLTAASTYPEKWTVIGGTKKKAQIIGGYIIDHIFDNPYTISRFQIGRDESLERIRRERSKERITFRLGNKRLGEIQILSADMKRIKDFERALIGFGAQNVLLDDAPLANDEIFATVLRMVGGKKDSFLGKIGNPFKRNHFLKSFRSPRYHNIVIDYRQGIEEGRITKEFIEEAREDMPPEIFDILYECKFPEVEAMDTSGYMPLVTEKQLDLVYRDAVELFGELRLGVDVAGGGRNKSVIVLRGDNGAKVIYRESTPDTMVLAGEVLKAMDQHKIKNKNVFVDVIGVGKGVYDRLNEQKIGITNVTAGEEPENQDDRFINIKAQMFWRMAEWIRGGGILGGQKEFDELLDVKYKVQSDKKIKIKSKEEMLKENILSPDVADALAMTFARERTPIREKTYKQKPYQPISKYEGR